MLESWRWFGPADPTTLEAVRQTGARGIVTALHDIPYGEVWTHEAVAARKALIEADPSLGLAWLVVESLPIHERIKQGAGDLSGLFDAYRRSMQSLARNGVRVICYNFMPVLDWTRTELRTPLPGGGTALRYNAHEFAAFDCYMLERPGAEADFPSSVIDRARDWFKRSLPSDRDRLLSTIMAGLPGAFDRYDIPALKSQLARYRAIGREELRANLVRFLKEIIPAAEELGQLFAIHPDDPPRPLMGLTRIVSSEQDIAAILDAVPSRANGLTLCSGSLGAGAHNDPVSIARRFADRIHFVHLRNVRKEPDGSFQEAEHLAGDTDMVALIDVLLKEESRRAREGRPDHEIPMRPDHGHELLDDVGKPTHPGYPAIGRLKGLAELRGVIAALKHPLASAR